MCDLAKGYPSADKTRVHTLHDAGPRPSSTREHSNSFLAFYLRASCPAIRIGWRSLFPPLRVFHPRLSACTGAAGHFPGLRPAAAADRRAPSHSSPGHRRRSKLARALFPEHARPGQPADNSVSVERLISRIGHFPRREPARCSQRPSSLAEPRAGASHWGRIAGARPAADFVAYQAVVARLRA